MLTTYLIVRARGLDLARRLGSRVDSRSESGQVSAEYIGVIVVVAAVTIALAGLAGPIAQTFEDLIIQNLKDAFGG